MQDINKKEGFSHPFFLNLLGLFVKVCQLDGVKKVSKPLKIYIHFLASFFIFSVLTDNDWQEESNPLKPLQPRYSEIILEVFLLFEIIQELSWMNYGDF